MSRIYIPAHAALLRTLADSGELKPAAPVHTVTEWLRREHPGADIEELEYTAFDDAAASSVAMLVGQVPRRVVISADVAPERLTEHSSGTAADLGGGVKLKKVAAIHVDDADAADQIASALDASEVDLAAVEEHMLDWYAPSELQDLLGALGISRP